MPRPVSTPSENQAKQATITQLRAAIETLEALAANHGLLALLPEAERRRLRQAAASVYNPDARQRRRMVKAVIRERKSAAAREDEQVRADTGIRTLRRRPVFTTPNVFPPPQSRATKDAGPAALLHLQAGLLRRPSLLRSAVPGVRRPELHQANRAGRSAGTRGAADRRARQDRLPGGAQAAAGRARSSSSRRAFRATRPPATPPSRTSTRGAIAWRSSASICGTRPASRRFARTWPPRAAGWTSSSTTPARPCAGHPSSTRT